MKQKLSGPVAIGIGVVVALLLLGGFYMKYVHEDSYSLDEIGKTRAKAEAKLHDKMQSAPPNIRHGQ